jgi:hypothetical protein
VTETPVHVFYVGSERAQLEPALKVCAVYAEEGNMQITVSCHACGEEKRPLAPCPACESTPLAELELHAWRASLHATGLARITATPQAADLGEAPIRSTAPIRAVLITDELPATAPATIIPLEPPLSVDETLSFDWEDKGRRRLRRSA